MTTSRSGLRGLLRHWLRAVLAAMAQRPGPSGAASVWTHAGQFGDFGANRQFLGLVARSGTALFVFVDPAARDDRTDRDLTQAVRTALDGGTPGGVEPRGWQSTTAPRRWRSADGTLTYGWGREWGAWPLPV